MWEMLKVWKYSCENTSILWKGWSLLTLFTNFLSYIFFLLGTSTLLSLRINCLGALRLRNTCVDVQNIGACIYVCLFVLWTYLHQSFTLSSQQLKDCLHVNLFQPIQTLSFSLISPYMSDIQRDNSLCPLSHSIIFWHLQEDRTFQPPLFISPNFTPVTFCFQAIVVFLQAHAHILADLTIIFMEYILLYTLSLY